MLAAISLITVVSFLSLFSLTADEPVTVRFREISGRAGIDFYHMNGATRHKYMPETIGAGGLFWDFDGDGWLDIFLVDSGWVANASEHAEARSLLYRNRGDGTFDDVTSASGIRVSGYGMGSCSADYDNDGRADLYVTSFGANQLFRNAGEGKFRDVTKASGTGSDLWGTSCAFFDADNDGDVDLYVTNFVEFSAAENKFCGDVNRGLTAYCHPNVYTGVPDVLYRNNGDGTFTDVTRAAGLYTIAGKGLGVVIGDINNDGWPDIYVANDSVPNFLFENQGDGTFKETGAWAGVEVNGDGRPEAGMGTDLGDFDEDGRLDIFVTNLDIETNTLYKNSAEGLFGDVTSETGQGEPSVPYVGFGTAFLDYDNDGDFDLAVVNGNIMDNASQFRDGATYAQLNLLLQNQGGGFFVEVGESAGPGFGLVKVSRGLAVGDIDNDGDLDLLVTNNGDTPDLLLNMLNEGGNRGNSILVRLTGTSSNRSAVGARVTVTVGERSMMRELKAGSSYLSQNDLRLHFGLGKAEKADRLVVRWPGGAIQVFEGVGANQILSITEGEQALGRQPFTRP